MLEPEATSPGVAGQRALETLRSDGLAIVPFDELIDDGELWAELAADMRRFVSSAEQRALETRNRAQRPEYQSKKAKKRAGNDRRRKIKKDDFILRLGGLLRE